MLINKNPRKGSGLPSNQPKNPNNEGMNNIFSMIGNQESQITSLLKKYGSEQVQDSHFYPRTINEQDLQNQSKEKLMDKIHTARQRNKKTIEGYTFDDKSSRTLKVISRISKSQDKDDKFILPSVIERLSKSREKKLRAKGVVLKQKKQMKSNLYNIYGRNNKFVQHNIKHVGELSRSKSKKKLRKRDKLTPITPLTPADSRDDRKITQSQMQQKYFGNENSYKIEVDFSKVDSDYDDSQAEDIPVTYYERQFRDAMRAQCTQQINFLYFSRNEVMKDWTQTLLSMIQRHDKEVTSIRRKSKYLQTFDHDFFTIGIYQDD